MHLEQFIANLEELIVDEKQQDAADLCAKNEDLIKDNSFEVLERITGYICEENYAGLPRRFNLAVDLMTQITEFCSYDDVLLGLHKEIADTEDEIKFVHLLQPLKIALTKTPEKKFKCAIWCFNAIQTFLSNMPAPESLNLEDSDEANKASEEIDFDVHRILTVYDKVLDLYVSVQPKFTSEDNSLLVRKYILQLLGKPFCYLDLNQMATGYRRAATLMSLITSNCDPYKFLTWLNFKQIQDEDVKVPRLALATYFYLLLAIKVNFNEIPKVYDSIFVFRHVLHYLAELFTYDQQFVTEKGLQLAEYAFHHSGRLPHQLLDEDIHSKFVEKLSKVIIYSPMKRNRQKALEIFRKYILGFDQRGRYLIIHNAFKSVNHSGLMGYLITLYKDLLVERFKAQEDLGAYFRGPKLATLVMQFCHLHKQEESDMLELADQIIPALNLLRYLAIRDKHNATGIRELFAEVKAKFFEPLKKGLVLSKAHYKLKMKDLREESAKGDEDRVKSEVSVTIAGESLPHLSVEEKMNVLSASMTAFDVMESVLARLNECVEGSPVP